jgi:hypothetical protein
MLSLGAGRHLLRATNTQAGPSAPQRQTLQPNFNSLFVGIDVDKFKTLLLTSELVMRHANGF